MGLRVSYRHFAQDAPQLYTSKIQYLETVASAEELQALEMNFTDEERVPTAGASAAQVRTVELVPGGAKVRVTIDFLWGCSITCQDLDTCLSFTGVLKTLLDFCTTPWIRVVLSSLVSPHLQRPIATSGSPRDINLCGTAKLNEQTYPYHATY